MVKDKYHDWVKRALEQDGWTITHDQYPLNTGTRILNIDLGAEKLLAAQRGTEKIAIEIKSFGGPSPMTEFYQALGQFEVYEELLADTEKDRLLYLAIPENTYHSFFQETLTIRMVEKFQIRLLVFGVESTEIVLWKK